MSPAVEASGLERLLRRDRAVTLVALLAAILLAWSYLLSGIGVTMPSMPMPGMDMPMPMPPDWTATYFALMFAMWAIMMVAMMLPSAAPMILLFAAIERRRRGVSPLPAVARFTAAYIAIWTGFSAAATVLQWQFDRLALLSADMASARVLATSVILVAVGLYQFTPWKQACLQACRTPLEFISRHWGRGPFGIGLRHGLFCLGCCWMLMLLLFVGGVMNLLWVALIAAFVLVEKISPRGQWVSYAVGAALVAWGLGIAFTHVPAVVIG